MDGRELKARSDLMLALARRAGELSLTHFQRGDLAVDWKANATEVTAADREGERLITDGIAAAFPDDAVVGEEHGKRDGKSGWTWWIDPIDGTRSFARGVPLYAVLIGLEYAPTASLPGDRASRPSEILAGVIELPALAERVYATDGAGAWWERTGHPRVPAQVSTCKKLSDALLCTTSYDYYKKSNRVPHLNRLHESAGSLRGWSDAYAFALAATGRVDIALDPVMHPWDNGPYPVIFREAGGVFTDWQGRERIDGGDGVACNAALHVQVLRVIAG